MGRKPVWPPKLVRKPGTAEARCYYRGRWHTCGKWDVLADAADPAARAAHARLIAVWAADPAAAVRPKGEVLVGDVLTAWLLSSDAPPAGTHALQMAKLAAGLLRPWAGRPAAAFGPLELIAWQDSLAAEDYARNSILGLRRPVLLAFAWAEDTDRVPLGHAARLTAALARRDAPGRAEVRRKPADPHDVAAVRRHFRGAGRSGVAAIVEVSWRVGPRVGELVAMTVGDVQRTGTLETPHGAKLRLTGSGLWGAVVRKHKTRGKGFDRVILFGPKCQKVIVPLLDRPADAPLFDLHDGRADNYKRAATPKALRHCYWHAVKRACVAVGVPHWTPRQLRVAVADRVQEEFGLEAAAAYLGHAPRTVTGKHYAGLNLKQVAKVAARLG